MDESAGVTAVQADAGLIEDVERTYERRAQRCAEIDALAFAATQRVGSAVQREVVESYFREEPQPALDFGEQAARHFCFVFVQLQHLEPSSEITDGHLYKVRYALSTYLHPCGFLFQASAVTDGTDRLSAIAAQHDAILYLVLILLHHLEEGVNRYLFVDIPLAFRGEAVPEHVLLVLRQFVVGFEDGEVVFGCPAAELILPHAHLVAVPTLHAAVVDAQRGVGNDELLVDADNLAEAFTLWAGAQRRVEREHLVAGFFERDTIGFEACREIVAET